MYKSCSRCKISKPHNGFYSNKSKSDGLCTECKECTKLLQSARRQNPLKRSAILEQKKAYSRSNAGIIARKASRQRLVASDPDYNKNGQLKTKYGITIQDYNQMLERQCGVCAICKEKDTTDVKLSVDHNHNNDEIRGLLCNLCNKAIGLMRDSPSILREAAMYLETTDYKLNKEAA